MIVNTSVLNNNNYNDFKSFDLSQIPHQQPFFLFSFPPSPRRTQTIIYSVAPVSVSNSDVSVWLSSFPALSFCYRIYEIRERKKERKKERKTKRKKDKKKERQKEKRKKKKERKKKKKRKERRKENQTLFFLGFSFFVELVRGPLVLATGA